MTEYRETYKPQYSEDANILQPQRSSNNFYYPSFDTIAELGDSVFYRFFKNNLPSYRKVKNWQTPKQKIFKQYFVMRNQKNIRDDYLYACLYKFQGQLLSSSSSSENRKTFFEDIVSFLILSSNVSVLLSGSSAWTSDFLLKCNLNKIEDISLKCDDEWKWVQMKILAYLLVAFFKKNPSALEKFMSKYYQDNDEFVNSLLEEKKQIRLNKRKKILDTKKSWIEEVFEMEEWDDVDWSSLLRKDELWYMNIVNGEVRPPNRWRWTHFQIPSPCFPEEEWRMNFWDEPKDD